MKQKKKQIQNPEPIEAKQNEFDPAEWQPEDLEKLAEFQKTIKELSEMNPDLWKASVFDIILATVKIIINTIKDSQNNNDLIQDPDIIKITELLETAGEQAAIDYIMTMSADKFRRLRNSVLSSSKKNAISENLIFPVDKVNAKFSRLWESLKDKPERQLYFDMTSKEEKDTANTDDDKSYVLLSLGFDDKSIDKQELSKVLTPINERIYIAANALDRKNKNRPITVQQIYKQMGYENKISAPKRKILFDAMTAMRATTIYIDNSSESKKQKGRKEFIYDGSLFPFERVTTIENGQATDFAIRLLRESPLITFARERNQITTVSRKLLQTPVNKNDSTIAIEDYLIRHIAHAKTGKLSRRIRFDTLFDSVHITTKKQQDRSKDKIVRILDHYKQQAFIDGYKMDETGIEVSFKGQPKKPGKKEKKGQ